MGQLCPALTHCVFVSYLQFVFPSMTPQGTLGHSWQKTQIGFKAKLSRLKNEPSNPEQMELCVFFFPPLLVCQTLSLLLLCYCETRKVRGYV